jgi:hypothetical protein
MGLRRSIFVPTIRTSPVSTPPTALCTIPLATQRRSKVRWTNLGGVLVLEYFIRFVLFSFPVEAPISLSGLGPFPLIVFSPGFLGSHRFYAYIWDALVPRGYVVAVTSSYDRDPLSLPDWKARDQSFMLGALFCLFVCLIVCLFVCLHCFLIRKATC